MSDTLTRLRIARALSGAVFTDGSGKINGLVYTRVYFGGPNNQTTNYGAFTITVIGNTSNRGTNPLVRMSLRGNGYYFDGVTNHPNASLSLNFVSTNQLVDVPALVLPNGATNSAFTYLSGTVRGSISRGKNGGPSLTIKENGEISTAATIGSTNGTNFVETSIGGSLILNVLTNLDAQVLQPVPNTSRLYLNAYVGSLFDLLLGTGSANYSGSAWSASFSGVAFARGCTLQANGTLGPQIFYQSTTDTNNFPSGYIPILATNVIQTMTITGGKIFGQKVPSNNNIGISVWPPPPGS